VVREADLLDADLERAASVGLGLPHRVLAEGGVHVVIDDH
jgi:hypothetical protein